MEPWERALGRAARARREYETAMGPFRTAEGGRIFRAARDRLGISQAEMADRLGTSQGYLSRVETGKIAAGWGLVGRLDECSRARSGAPKGGHR